MHGALVEGGPRHPWRGLRFPEGHGIEQPAVVDAPRQQRCPQFRREARKMVKLHAIEVGQAFVPVVAVLFHHPDFFIDAPGVPERPRARGVHHPPQIVVIVFQRLLAHDDVPAARKRCQHKTGGAGLVECELDGVRVTHIDLADARKQRCAGDTDALRRSDDAGVGRLDVLSGARGAIVEHDPLTQKERIRFAIRRDLPVVRQVGDDGLAAVQRIAPDQIVIHTALRAHIVHRPRLMDIKVRRRTRDPIP